MELKDITVVFLFFLFSGLVMRNKDSIFIWIHDFTFINMVTNIYDEDDLKEESKKNLEQKQESKIQPKYEEKYLDQLHEMNPDYVFTEEEQINEEEEFHYEKEMYKKKRFEMEKKIDVLESKTTNTNEYDYDNEKEQKEHIKEILQEVEKLKKEYENLSFKEEDIRKDIRQKIIQKKLEKLKNCFIFEKTPLGNVAMFYNEKRETFEYFSDSTIPYRFLEVVARKYVVSFHCRPLYVIMEEELKKYEKKVEEKLVEEKKVEEQQKQNNLITNHVPKKNVFAKFKSYNKEAGSGRVNKAPPPKNSIPRSTQENANVKVILKENANRYTYEGRFSNFNPLQKVERKQIDKKYAMSFAEFKKRLITS